MNVVGAARLMLNRIDVGDHPVVQALVVGMRDGRMSEKGGDD
jgi:hypothetical protein